MTDSLGGSFARCQRRAASFGRRSACTRALRVPSIARPWRARMPDPAFRPSAASWYTGC